MLCGLSIPRFRRKTKRVRPVISAPIVQSVERMGVWRNHNQHHADDKSDSGVFYLVPNQNGTGKQIIRRPRPPPTSPPLDDDFDAITQTQTQVGTTSRYRDYEVKSVWATSPTFPTPLSRDFENKTQHASPQIVSATRPNVHAHTSKIHVPQQQTSGLAPSGSVNRKGKAKDETYGQYRGYQSYMHEMEKMFGKSGDLDISVEKLNGEDRESVNIGRVKSTKSRRTEISRPTRVTKDSRSSEIARNASLSSNGGKGPKPRQDYEIVSRRVIEDTPDKTVTISTWREHVAREVDPEDERMSIYYVGPDLLSDTSEIAREEVASSIAAATPNGQRHLLNGGDNESGATTPISNGQGHFLNRTDSESGATTPVSNGKGHTLNGGGAASGATTPIPNSNISSSSEYAYRSGRNGRSKNQSRPSRRRQTVPKPATRKAQTLVLASQRTSSSNTMASSETVSTGQSPPTPPPKPPKLFIKTGFHQSTPIDSRMPILSFHPTRSGSTISSIRSSSTSSASYALHKVLKSCKPPLGHLAPILARLGITETDHLKAVAQLSPETRDREVKEEALKQGVTVVEWAVLVDHLRLL